MQARSRAKTIHLETSAEALKEAYAKAAEVVGTLQPIYDYLASIQDFPDQYKVQYSISYLSQRLPYIFAKRYFFKNVVKCAIAAKLSSAGFKNVRRVIDLGTGPGTFLFSFTAALKNNEFVGIDKSISALSVCAKLFGLVRLPPPLLILAELPDAIIGGGRSFTASYLLCEMDDPAKHDLAKFIVQRPDAQFLIVDYPDVIYDFSGLLGGARHCSVRELRKLNLPPWLASKVGDDEISLGILFAPIVASTYRRTKK